MHNNIVSTDNIIYVILCCLFCTVIVTGNLIFQKFVMVNFWLYTFEVSAGVMLFPLTFLISDLVTEFYGKRAATIMINTALLACALTIGLIAISDYLVAASWSPINDSTFSNVFNGFTIGATTSVIANYCGQKIEIQVYSWIKKITKSKHLWLRNNISTIAGQFIDTTFVVLMLTTINYIPLDQALAVVVSSFAFKVIMAILDTPLCYLGYYLISKTRVTY